MACRGRLSRTVLQNRATWKILRFRKFSLVLRADGNEHALRMALAENRPIPKRRVSFSRLDADDWAKAAFRECVRATASF